MPDPIKDLPRLDEKAMGPCVCCKRQLLETGFPLFLRLDLKRCGLDANEIRRHCGLAMAMGGGTAGLALAGVLGPGVKPVVVMDAFPAFNVCNECQSKHTLEEIMFRVMGETEGESDGNDED